MQQKAAAPTKFVAGVEKLQPWVKKAAIKR
jgi:hypothetical protein